MESSALRATARYSAIKRGLARLEAKFDHERRRQDLARIGWLGLRFGMAPADIEPRVVGFSAPEILRLLQVAAADLGSPASDVEQVQKGAHLAAGVSPVLPLEIGAAHEQKRRLTHKELHAILTEPAALGVNVRLADKYGVSSTYISTIRNRNAARRRAGLRIEGRSPAPR